MFHVRLIPQSIFNLKIKKREGRRGNWPKETLLGWIDDACVQSRRITRVFSQLSRVSLVLLKAQLHP